MVARGSPGSRDRKAARTLVSKGGEFGAHFRLLGAQSNVQTRSRNRELQKVHTSLRQLGYPGRVNLFSISEDRTGLVSLEIALFSKLEGVNSEYNISC